MIKINIEIDNDTKTDDMVAKNLLESSIKGLSETIKLLDDVKVEKISKEASNDS